MTQTRWMKRYWKFTLGSIVFFCFYIAFPPFLSQAGYTEFRMGEPVVIINDSESTKVDIKGNSVIVPARIVHRGSDVEIQLLLDTGATKTMINTDVAEKLSINLGNERKSRVQVVGGAMIEARVVKFNSLTIGPHVKRNWDIIVVPHNGPAVEYDGLLGMDVLRGLKYRVDFKKKIIEWE